MKRSYRGIFTVLVIAAIAFEVGFEPLSIERQKPPENPLTVRFGFDRSLVGIPQEPPSSAQPAKAEAAAATIGEKPKAAPKPMTRAELVTEIETLLNEKVTLNPDAEKKVDIPADNQVVLNLVLTPGQEREEAERYKQIIQKALQDKYGGRAGMVRLVEKRNPQQERAVARIGPVRVGRMTLLPTLLINKPVPRVKLGLDLQGGVHLVLECVPVSTFTFLESRSASEGAAASEEAATGRDWAKLGQELRAYLAGQDVDVRAVTPVERGLTITTRTAERGEADRDRQLIQSFLAARVPGIIKDREENMFLKSDTITTVRQVIQRRVDGFGLTEPLLQVQGDRRLLVELPGTAPEDVPDIIGRPADLKFMYIDPNKYDFEPVKLTPEQQARTGSAQLEKVKVIDKRTKEEVRHSVAVADPTTNTILRGRDLRDNSQQQPSMEGTGWEVAFEFKPGAAKVFRQFTSTHIGKPLAIVLNDEIVSAPTIKSTIGARGVITGSFSSQEAGALAVLLNAGALPIPLEIVENQRVSATLGRHSVAMSLRAGIIGAICILLFMIAYYRLPGLVADVALAIYALLTLAVLIAMDATLTLTGIAGFLLSIGMAVDANVLIFERLKEELRAGKSLRLAIDAAFARAWTAILDSNVTTILAALVLMIFIPGGVRGFATTLTIGVLCSMFTAIVVTKILMQALIQTRLARVRAFFLGHP